MMEDSINIKLNEDVKKYKYVFGIDDIKIGKATIPESACFISEEIEIGYLKEDEYLQITSKYNCGMNNSIEFYIIDGSEPIPILPVEEEKIVNEKIFYGLRTRFSINNDEEIVIKENGHKLNIDLEDAIILNTKNLTIDYVPVNAYSVKPTSQYIKIKIIIRNYDKTTEAPSVENVTVKKFGGNSLWEIS